MQEGSGQGEKGCRISPRRASLCTCEKLITRRRSPGVILNPSFVLIAWISPGQHRSAVLSARRAARRGLGVPEVSFHHFLQKELPGISTAGGPLFARLPGCCVLR